MTHSAITGVIILTEFGLVLSLAKGLDEAARVHHPHRRRGGCVAARGARAASGVACTLSVAAAELIE